MPPDFDSEYLISQELFDSPVFLPWTGSPPRLSVSLSGTSPTGAQRVEPVEMRLDTGSTWTCLTLATAQHLGLDTTWAEPAELARAQTSGGSYLISIRRSIFILLGGKWIPIRGYVPIKYSDPLVDAQRWSEAQIKCLGSEKYTVSREFFRNLLGLNDLLALYLISLTEAGAYLFPRRQRLDPVTPSTSGS